VAVLADLDSVSAPLLHRWVYRSFLSKYSLLSISKMMLFVITGEGGGISQTPLSPCQLLVINCVGFSLLLRALQGDLVISNLWRMKYENK